MDDVLSLNGIWSLTWAEGGQLSWPYEFCQEKPAAGRPLLAAEVPSPVHRVLEKHGLLDDPNLGMNSFRARWVEECFWIYRRTFSAPETACSGTAHLVFDRLEMTGKILLNGEEVGICDNALYPVRVDVSGKLRRGENTLTVVLESGVFSYADHAGKNSEGGETGWMTKRNWLRKAQYQSGWDWNPRLQNVGILGDVRLEYAPGALAGLISLRAEASEDLSSARVTVAADAYRREGQPDRAELKVRIVETGEAARTEVSLPVGKSRSEAELTLNAPELWWPVGCGGQFRYTAEVEFLGRKQILRFGVRKIAVDQSPHPEAGRYFILKVNDRPVFCKGGNFVPADLYYSEVDAGRYRELVEIARQANFNLLRIWGGGIYMTPEFCDVCDELGVLIWHDFIFACAKDPGEDVDFVANVRREAEFVVRELGSHPSLAVWCGNNELETGNWNWYPGNTRVGWSDHAIFHHDLAKIVHDEAPQVFYWPSSPFSPDFKNPEDPTCGDQHPWELALRNPGGTDFWGYRSYIDRFPNEGGVLGASTVATMKQFLPEKERFVRSLSWEHHDNPFARRDAEWNTTLGHSYATVSLWTGRDPLKMSIEEYAVISGLLQAEGLEEYIYNYRRRMFSSAAAIFWMFNDSWPVSNGWTIIDYYLRRKLSFHPVRRAFADIAVVVVAEPERGEVTVFGVNDTDAEFRGTLRYGVFSLKGGLPVDRTVEARLSANASTVLAQFPYAEWEACGLCGSGAFAVLSGSDGAEAASHRVFVRRFGELKMVSAPEVKMELGDGKLTLTSEAFVWKLCLDLDGERQLPDNAFDLLPGIPKVLPWSGALPKVLATGNAYGSAD